MHIGLNYFTRKPVRQIILGVKEISIQGDFIATTLSAVIDSKTLDFPGLTRNAKTPTEPNTRLF